MAVVVEPATNNARRLFAGVDIAAPVAIVWDALTDYDGLGNFIPGRSAASSISQDPYISMKRFLDLLQML